MPPATITATQAKPSTIITFFMMFVASVLTSESPSPISFTCTLASWFSVSSMFVFLIYKNVGLFVIINLLLLFLLEPS